MGKVKLNLVSGSSVEKPLVNAFIENNNTYVVLDNEINGSMGLPIILVSKLENDKLVKIVDQNEWQLVKEYLKNIIAGNKVEFVKLNNELNADDIYYTQLTLPVPSFDALKKSYTFNESEPTINVIADNINNEVVASAPAEEVPAVNNEPANQEIQVNNDEPIVATEPIINFDNNISINNEQVSPVEPAVNNTPVMPEVPTDTTEINQEIPTIAVDTNANNADIQNEPMVDLNNPLFNNISTILDNEVKIETPKATVNDKEPEITPSPIIETNYEQPAVVEESIFKEQKEAFMQACENMFDALVQKFEKELESKKN